MIFNFCFMLHAYKDIYHHEVTLRALIPVTLSLSLYLSLSLSLSLTIHPNQPSLLEDSPDLIGAVQMKVSPSWSVIYIYIYIYISNIHSASKDNGCGLITYRIYKELLMR